VFALWRDRPEGSLDLQQALSSCWWVADTAKRCGCASSTALSAGLAGATKRAIRRQPEQTSCTAAMAIETTYTAARDQLKALMDRVVADREVVMVRRRQGGDVALVAADELEGLLETAHLLRSPRNAARLLSALERSRSEELPALRLEDLEARLEA